MEAADASAADAAIVGSYRRVRELKGHALPMHAAHRLLGAGREQLVVLEAVPRDGTVPDVDIADFVRDARAVMELRDAHVARVYDVSIEERFVLVAGEWVTGETLASFIAAGAPRSVLVRILRDAVSGLAALHALSDSHGAPLRLVHGALTPQNIIVGLDGVARVTRVRAIRHASLPPPASAVGYLAPEILLGDGTADSRADLYSAGALLYEALSGSPPFREQGATAVVMSLLAGRIARPTLAPEDAWAEPLVELALRTLVADPARRPATAGEFLAALQAVNDAHVASRDAVAAYAEKRFGDSIRARHTELAPKTRSTPALGTPKLPPLPASIPRPGNAPQVRPAKPSTPDAVPRLSRPTPLVPITPAPPPPKAPVAPATPIATAVTAARVERTEDATTAAESPLPLPPGASQANAAVPADGAARTEGEHTASPLALTTTELPIELDIDIDVDAEPTPARKRRVGALAIVAVGAAVVLVGAAALLRPSGTTTAARAPAKRVEAAEERSSGAAANEGPTTFEPQPAAPLARAEAPVTATPAAPSFAEPAPADEPSAASATPDDREPRSPPASEPGSARDNRDARDKPSRPSRPAYDPLGI
jgi:serine/threonine-protein kinase